MAKSTRNLLLLSIVVFIPSAEAQSGLKPSDLKSLVKPGTELMLGDRKQIDPLQLYNHLAEPSLAASAAIKETPGCARLQVWEPVYTTRTHLRTIFESARPGNSEVGALVFDGAINCVRVGQPIALAEFHAEAGVSTPLGYFMPNMISAPTPALASLENLMLISAGFYGKKMSPVFVSGRLIVAYLESSPQFYSPRMQGARMISRDQIEAAVAQGTQIVDVRSKRQFDLVRLKGATHVPYTIGSRAKLLDTYSNFAKTGDAFDIRRVNSDRTKPVILIGENFESQEPIRAAIVLRSEGWKQVYIFQEGMSFFTQMMSFPPFASSQVGVIHKSLIMLETRNDAALATQVIDVRDAVDFKRASIQGSINAPYVERDDLKLRRSGLNGTMLKTYGDTWTPPEGLVKTATLVFVGSHRLDWRPYKAALMAKSLGFRSVFYYSGGFSDWNAMSLEHPNLYRTVRGLP